MRTMMTMAAGCLLAGIAVGVLSGRPSTDSAYLFVVTGVLGGMTTFSAFGIETVGLMKSGNFGVAAAYVLAKLIIGFGGVALGMAFSR